MQGRQQHEHLAHEQRRGHDTRHQGLALQAAVIRRLGRRFLILGGARLEFRGLVSGRDHGADQRPGIGRAGNAGGVFGEIDRRLADPGHMLQGFLDRGDTAGATHATDRKTYRAGVRVHGRQHNIAAGSQPLSAGGKGFTAQPAYPACRPLAGPLPLHEAIIPAEIQHIVRSLLAAGHGPRDLPSGKPHRTPALPADFQIY